VLVRARVKTEPAARWNVGRELNRRIKQRFDALGIQIPRPTPMVMVERAAETRPDVTTPAASEAGAPPRAAE